MPGIASPRRRHRATKAALLLALLALVLGTWAGLVRIGWPGPPLTLAHGPLMVTGFLATLIGLERAVGLRRRGAFAAPILTGVGTLVILLPGPPWRTPAIVTGGAGALLALFLVLYRRQPGVAMGTMAAGAALLLAGNLAWLLGSPLPQVVPLWIGFVVVLIAGERRELTRFLPLSRATNAAFLVVVGLLVAGIATTVADAELGARLLAVGLVAVAAWLLLFDMASRTARTSGLARYTAVGLLAGYVWLGLAGVLAMAAGLPPAGILYDGVLHAVFLGFTFSMVFAHGPIIFPAVLRRPIAYTAAFYVPLALLHGSLAVRLAGDVAANADARMWGGLLNAIAILAFFAVTAASLRRRV